MKRNLFYVILLLTLAACGEPEPSGQRPSSSENADYLNDAKPYAESNNDEKWNELEEEYMADSRLDLAALHSDLYTAIDQILEKLEFGNIAFNAPHVININDTTIIELFLGLAAPIDELKKMIKAEGVKEGARIKITERMEARLSGANFDITAVTPEVQLVSRVEVTEWKWEVKPVREGKQHLHLTLSALISIDGETTRRAIRTFDKEIEVEVTWDQQVGSFIESHLEWLVGAFVLPIFFWLWSILKNRK